MAHQTATRTGADASSKGHSEADAEGENTSASQNSIKAIWNEMQHSRQIVAQQFQRRKVKATERRKQRRQYLQKQQEIAARKQKDASCTKWQQKRSPTQKKRLRRLHKKQLKQLHPTREDLKNGPGALQYCKERGLSETASRRVVQLVLGTVADVDHRDQRSLPRAERVPRSLEPEPMHPAHFWDINYMPPVKYSSSRFEGGQWY